MKRWWALVVAAALPACGRTEPEGDAQATCDVLEPCGPLNTTRRLCPQYIGDRQCGAVYAKYIECYAEHCPGEDDEAGVICEAEAERWQYCRTF